MQRGHAEALMPLIARVLARSNLDFSALDRIAVTTGPGSFTGLRVGIAAARGIALAAGKPADRAVDTGCVRRAIDRRRRHVACGGGDRCAPRSRLPASVRTRRPHAGRAADSPVARSIAGVDIRRAAHDRQCGQHAGRRLASRRTRAELRSISAARPISIGWRGLARPQPTPARRRSRFTCARPTPIRRTPCNWRADDRLHQQFFLARRAGDVGGERARRVGHRGVARRFVPARLERTGSRRPADRPPCASRIAR